MQTVSFTAKPIYLITLVATMLLLPVVVLAASDQDREMSPDEIATELSNPVTALRFIGNGIEYRTYAGSLPESADQNGLVYRFEPSFPFKLKNGKNLLIRASIPLNLEEPEWRVDVDHPIFEVDRDYTEFLLRQSPQVTPDSGHFRTVHGHLSDITFDVAYGDVNDRGFISMYGIAGVLPSSQNISGAREQLLLGPEIALGKMADWGVIGIWAKQLIDVNGDESFNTNETSIDLFFAYGLGHGWQIISNPSVLYDWEADSGNELLLSLGGGIAKTLQIGSIPVKMELEIYNYVVTPDRFGREWLMTFKITPVISSLFQN